MARAVDPKRTRKALRQVRKLAALREEDAAPDYSAWEAEFLTEVETRLETYGSAFADLRKGPAEEALSRLQTQKLKEIARKAKGKPARGFGGLRRSPKRAREPQDD